LVESYNIWRCKYWVSFTDNSLNRYEHKDTTTNQMNSRICILALLIVALAVVNVTTLALPSLGQKKVITNQDALKLFNESVQRTKTQIDKITQTKQSKSRNVKAEGNNCTVKEAKQVAARYQALQDMLSNVTALLSGGAADLGESVSGELDSLTSLECTSFAMAVMQQGQDITKKVTVNTDECLVQDAADPCCNRDLLQNECCLKRDVTLNVIVGKNGTSSLAKAFCTDPEKITQEGAALYSLLVNQASICQERASQSADDISSNFDIDFESLFAAQPTPCTSNTQCSPLSVCEKTKGTCQVIGVDLSGHTVLANVFLTIFGDEGKPFLTGVLGLPTTSTVDTVGAALQQALTKEVCAEMTLLEGPQVTDEYKTKASCEAVMTCNNPTLESCKGEDFCGIACDEVCTSVVPGMNKTACEKSVVCLSSTYEISVKPSAEACLEGSYKCSVDCKNCTKQQCEGRISCDPVDASLGYFATSQGSCLYPLKKVTNDEGSSYTCSSGEKVETGCLVGETKQSTCTTAGGVFIQSYENTASACPTYSVCQKTGEHGETIYSGQNKASCEACGGRIINPLVKSNGVYAATSMAVPYLEFQSVKQVQEYSWESLLDQNKFQSMLQLAAIPYSLKIYRDLISCIYTPIVRGIDVMACDCGTDKDPAVSCFGKSYTAGVATVQPNADEDTAIEFGDLQITIPKGALTGATKITVTFTAPDTQHSARSIQESDNTVYVADAEGERAGQVVGTGFAVEPAIENLKICLKVDPNIILVDTKDYTTNGFAILNNNKYTAIKRTIENPSESSATQICGHVSDTKTYYPARVEKDIEPIDSSASRSFGLLFAVIVTLIVSIVSLF
jgi:hypothetical protein